MIDIQVKLRPCARTEVYFGQGHVVVPDVSPWQAGTSYHPPTAKSAIPAGYVCTVLDGNLSLLAWVSCYNVCPRAGPRFLVSHVAPRGNKLPWGRELCLGRQKQAKARTKGWADGSMEGMEGRRDRTIQGFVSS